MTLTKTLKTAAVAATVTTVSLVSATAAQAISFTTSIADQTSTVPGAINIDLDTDTFPSLTGGALVTGSEPNQYKAPGTDSGSPIVGTYLTVGGSNPPAPSPATLNFGSTPLKFFGLYWGSIDSYNTISFLNAVGNEIASFTGTDIAQSLGLDPLTGNYNRDAYVNFFAHGPSDYFSQVQFASTQAAFEAGNFAYEVIPTPALLPGLIGLGVAALRRKNDESAEENA